MADSLTRSFGERHVKWGCELLHCTPRVVVYCPQTARHRLAALSCTWKPGLISKFPKRAQSAKHLRDNTQGGLNCHLTLSIPFSLHRSLPRSPSLFSCVESQVKTATVAFLLAPKADPLISFRSEPLGFVYLIQYLCSVYVSECKTVCASNKQDTRSPDKCKKIQEWLGGKKRRKKQKWGK